MNIVNKVLFEVREDRGTTDEVKVGDYVVITNNYKGMYGERGTVIHTTRTQVSIRLMSGLIIKRGKKNVKIMTCQ
jgi:hypothetical protein